MKLRHKALGCHLPGSQLGIVTFSESLPQCSTQWEYWILPSTLGESACLCLSQRLERVGDWPTHECARGSWSRSPELGRVLCAHLSGRAYTAETSQCCRSGLDFSGEPVVKHLADITGHIPGDWQSRIQNQGVQFQTHPEHLSVMSAHSEQHPDRSASCFQKSTPEFSFINLCGKNIKMPQRWW